jgi:putative long chain acyl-CoA synthase
VVDQPGFALHGNHPIRLFIGSGMPTGLWRRVTEEFAPARVVEFFATTDGQAVLANVAGVKIGSKGRPLPGGGEVELAAYDVESDLILENERGFVQVARADQVGVLLARPRGPVDPNASVKRGVFAPADTWVSTESLFRRDADGDCWLVGNRTAAIHTARGVVFAEPITDAISLVGAVDLAVTYAVPGHADEQIAVTAVTLLPGANVTAADLTEAVAAMPVGLPPDIVHVVADLPLSATYRPVVGALRGAGVPRAGRRAWYLDGQTGQFKRLTSEARREFTGHLL